MEGDNPIFKKSFLRKHVIRCNQNAMFKDVNLPFNLTVTANSSVPEQLEHPPFWKPCWRLGRLAWGHCVHSLKRAYFKEDNISSKMVECAVVGCSNRTPRDSKRWISFHRLPLKNKPLFKEWLVHIKKANLLKLGQCQVCLKHFEKFHALDTNPWKRSLGLLFINKSAEREGAMLYI